MQRSQTAPPAPHQTDRGAVAAASQPLLGAGWTAVAYAAALAAISVLALYLRLARAWSGIRDLLARTTPDDAYYYFTIARNITRGQGATLDGETITTGFHPLWLFITLPVFAIDDRVLAVHLALSLGAVLGAITTVLIFAIVARLLRNPRAGLLAAGVFAIHPTIVKYSVNGLETSLSLSTIALFTLAFIDLWQAPAPRPLRRYAVLGALAGLMMLARTDSAFALIAVLAAVAARESSSMRWRAPLAVAGAAAILVAPWLIWSYAATGSILQDSAVAGGYVARDLYFASNEDTLPANITHGLRLVRDTFIDGVPGQFLVPLPRSTTPFWIAAVVAAALVVALPASRRRDTLRAAGLVFIPFAGPIAMIAISAGIRWYVAFWYYAPFGLGLAIAAGIAAHYLEGLLDDARSWFTRAQQRSSSALRPIPAAPLYAGLYVVLALLALWRFSPSRFDGLWYEHPWQPEALDTARWLNENTPPGTRVAAYNAGIPAYFSDRPVTNLDGVMNRDAFEALRDCRTRDYVRQQGIDYAVDSRPMFEITSCALTLDADLEVVTEIGSIQPVLVAKVLPGSEGGNALERANHQAGIPGRRSRAPARVAARYPPSTYAK
jgi:hypothetical protein